MGPRSKSSDVYETHPKSEITDVYEYEKIPPDDHWPRFKVVHPYCPWPQTEAQREASRRYNEYHFRTLGILLGIAQDVITGSGMPRYCAYAICRRQRRCLTRKREDDWSVFPGPHMPPCVPPDQVENVRKAMNAFIESERQRHEREAAAGQAGAQPHGTGSPDHKDGRRARR